MVQVNMDFNNPYSCANVSSGDLVDEKGAIRFQASPDAPRQFSTVRAYKDVFLENVAVEGLVKSIWANVTVANSALNHVTACGNIDLLNSSVSHVSSEKGQVSIKQNDSTSRRVASVQAYQSVYLEGSMVLGRVSSTWGRVTASCSELNELEAYQDIVLDNSSANQVHSQKGSVVVRQMDGVKRSISNVTCCRQAIINQCALGNLTMNIEPLEEASLDLTGTEVKGKIAIKVHTISKIAHAAIAIFNALSQKMSEKKFTLLIKGAVMPLNLECEGFNLTHQQTDRGLLVIGTKKS